MKQRFVQMIYLGMLIHRGVITVCEAPGEAAGALAKNSVNICKAFGYTLVCLASRITGMVCETSYCQNNTFSKTETHKLFAILADIVLYPTSMLTSGSSLLEGDFPQTTCPLD